ncbi:MAG: thioredoxin domain-containing protein [Candidatus Dojkabacteria bacterium]
MEDTVSKPMAVTDATFESEVVEASKSIPVFVEVGADWCPPCRAIEPILDKFAAEDFKGKVKFVNVNADVNQAITGKYKISSIPTLMVFKDGESKVQQAGALSEPMMKDFINTYAFGGAGTTDSESMPMAA